MSKICLIACGVLAPDIQQIAEQLEIDIEMFFLQAALHDNPSKLKNDLQHEIFRLSEDAEVERIVIGYGLCGTGTVGIQAGSTKLVIPRVHDCISLFLGSDAAYKYQFKKYPGTFYFTQGWIDKDVQPLSQQEATGCSVGPRAIDDAIAKQPQAEKEKHIRQFFDSWKKNYQRSVFINTGVGNRKQIEQYAKNMAAENNWEYEEIKSDKSLLERLLIADRTDDDLLVVPPGHVTIYDPLSEKLDAVTAEYTNRKAGGASVITNIFGKDEEGPTKGLGIDAGGTYTDVVVFDFRNQHVLTKAKALTTKWNYTIGIKQALDKIDIEYLRDIELVSVSTTLATNAIVEHHGRKVGLFLMPPTGPFRVDEIGYTPAAIVKGRICIEGFVQEKIDAAQIIVIADDMIRSHDVKAFAVSGYASTVNPAHEIEVKKLLYEHTGLGVTCGHELSQLLNFKTRAITAALNARIIPYIESLLGNLQVALKAIDIDVPIMVVKGDGTLMSMNLAKERPVETIYSGPAASVAGAKKLTGQKDALVVDIGGTTTDTASIRNNSVLICSEGSVVANAHTHIKALSMRTKGLGGDSGIDIIQQSLSIGPVRVHPFAYFAQKYPGADQAINYIEKHTEKYICDTRPAHLLALTEHHESFPLEEHEKKILEVLNDRPYSVYELAQVFGVEYWEMVRYQNLLNHNIICKSSLTPTDVLHAIDKMSLWDQLAAQRTCRIYAQIALMEYEEFICHIQTSFTNELAKELFTMLINPEGMLDPVDSFPTGKEILSRWLDRSNHNFTLSVKLNYPIIGIGAPAKALLPAAAEFFNTKLILPEDADVANAIGAITSSISITHSIKLTNDQDGQYVIEGLPNNPSFKNYNEALDFANITLIEMVTNLAHKAGTINPSIQTIAEDQIVTAANGTKVFLGTIITASVTGRPTLRARES